MTNSQLLIQQNEQDKIYETNKCENLPRILTTLSITAITKL